MNTYGLYRLLVMKTSRWNSSHFNHWVPRYSYQSHPTCLSSPQNEILICFCEILTITTKRRLRYITSKNVYIYVYFIITNIFYNYIESTYFSKNEYNSNILGYYR